MTTNKSVSPTEFRLHNKNFLVDFSPHNYFEKLRFEMVFQKLIFWFWRHYGVYFYLQKLKFMEDTAMLQVYFYKTYLYPRFIKKLIRFKKSRGVENTIIGLRPAMSKFAHNWVQLYNPDLFRFLIRTKSVVKKDSRRLKFKKVGYTRLARLGKYRSKRYHNTAYSTGLVPYSKKALSFVHFFTYFFLHFFKIQSVILAKSLYKSVATQPTFQVEHETLLHQTYYLQKYRWAFDFLFLANFAVTYANMNFLLPFFFTHIIRKYKQFKYATMLFNVLRKLYKLKRTIRCIKILINGPYNRHGRTHFRILKIGTLSFSHSDSCIMYDAIQWLTPYGAVSLKLWIYYLDVDRVSMS